MKLLTRRQIEIRCGVQQAPYIQVMWLFKYRNQKYTVRKAYFGLKPWTLYLEGIEQGGFNGLTDKFKTREIARQYAHNQIDAVLGTDVNKVIAEMF